MPLPQGPAPRPGTDYFEITPAAPYAPTPGKIEVVEVFAYYCIHCATLQPRVNEWKTTLPADVEFRYVPMAHGQSEPIARAFFAADLRWLRHYGFSVLDVPTLSGGLSG